MWKQQPAEWVVMAYRKARRVSGYIPRRRTSKSNRTAQIADGRVYGGDNWRDWGRLVAANANLVLTGCVAGSDSALARVERLLDATVSADLDASGATGIEINSALSLGAVILLCICLLTVTTLTWWIARWSHVRELRRIELLGPRYRSTSTLSSRG